MQEMSSNFKRAYGAQSTNKQLAIELYDLEIENDPTNYAAWNNRGVCKAELGIENKDENLITDGKNDVEEAIRLANAVNVDYISAMKNIKWINEEINKL